MKPEESFIELDFWLLQINDIQMSVLAVILFLGACTKPPRLSMVTEYMEMGSLYFLIHSSGQRRKLTWGRRLKMLRDICRYICPTLPPRNCYCSSSCILILHL